MSEQLYRRGMGYSYDPAALEREIANGLAIRHTAQVEKEPLTESDLVLMEVSGTENDIRLQEIEFELAHYPTSDERVELEAERVVRLEQRRLDELADEHPQYANALRTWLLSEVDHLSQAASVIDDEMVQEAQILDQIIAEVNDENEAQPLIKIAETMKALVEAQHKLDEIRRQAEPVGA